MTLIDRLSKLDGPDREVDAEIYCFQHGHTYSRKYGNDYAMWVEGVPHEVKIMDRYLDKFTSSVDAAIELAEKVLPLYRWSAGFSRHVPHNAQIWVPSESGYYEGESDANRAIALCIAILRAKEASHDKG